MWQAARLVIMSESLAYTLRRVRRGMAVSLPGSAVVRSACLTHQQRSPGGERSMLLRRAAIGLTAVALATFGFLPAANASAPKLADLVGQGPVAWTPNVSAGTTVGQSTCN